MRTNDLVLLSYVDALLRDAGIMPMILDSHTSVVEGTIGVIPRRVAVDGADHSRAREILKEAGLAAELKL